MKIIRVLALASLIIGCGFALLVGHAQAPGIKRTDLQQHDLSIAEREVVQVASISRREWWRPGTRILVKK